MCLDSVLHPDIGHTERDTICSDNGNGIQDLSLTRTRERLSPYKVQVHPVKACGLEWTFTYRASRTETRDYTNIIGIVWLHSNTYSQQSPSRRQLAERQGDSADNTDLTGLTAKQADEIHAHRDVRQCNLPLKMHTDICDSATRMTKRGKEDTICLSPRHWTDRQINSTCAQCLSPRHWT